MEDREIVEIEQALKFAIREIRNKTQKKVFVSEFWNALNRRGLVENVNVDPLIGITLSM